MVWRALWSVLTLGIWCIAGTAVLVLLTGFAWFIFTPLVGIFAPAGVLMGMLMSARLIGRARQRRAFTVVGYLEQAARLNLPLPGMLRAAERSERGATSYRLGDLRRAMEAGMPVGVALERYTPEVPWRDRAEIAVGEQMGRLSATLSRVHARTLQRLRRDSGDQDLMLGWSYGAVIGAFAMLVLGGVTVLILPKYIEIFDDFDTALPWATRITFAFGQNLGGYLLVGSIAAVMLIAGWSLWSINHSADETWSRLPGVERLLNLLPGIGGMLRDRSWTIAYAAVAEALTAGYALPEALRLTSESAVSPHVRGRLLRMAEAIEGGAGTCAAASAAHLPALSLGLLGAVDDGADARQTFEFLSRYHGSRFRRWLSVLQAAVLPIMVILLSLVVGWLVYSLFVPLVELIYSVTPDWEVL